MHEKGRADLDVKSAGLGFMFFTGNWMRSVHLSHSIIEKIGFHIKIYACSAVYRTVTQCLMQYIYVDLIFNSWN